MKKGSIKIRLAAVGAALILGMMSFAGCASKIHVDMTDEDRLINEAMRDAIEEAMTTAAEETTTPVTEPIETTPETVFEVTPEETMLYKPDGVIRICIDPGHGFIDGGTGPAYLLNNMVEKDVTLAVSEFLKEDLTQYGFDVVMTHDGETFPITQNDDGNKIFNPFERVAYANTLNLDFFISIHCNSYEQDESVKGLRIYYNEKADSDNKEVKNACYNLVECLKKTFPEDKEGRIIAQSSSEAYYVTRKTNTTAILVEIGFVTNKEEGENMSDAEWQAKLAQGLADGIREYFKD